MRDVLKSSPLLSDAQKQRLAEMRRRWHHFNQIVLRGGLYKARHRRRIRRAHLAEPEAWTGEDPYAVVMIPPSAVASVMKEESCFRNPEDFGRIVGGDWDREVIPFEDEPLWQAFVERFVHGRRWEDTAFIRKIAAGEIRWHNCRTPTAIRARCRKVDKLYESIATHGVRRNAQVNPFSWRASLDDLTINIGRNGELIRNRNGMHRLCIARILGMEAVPAFILVRHRDWHARQQRPETVQPAPPPPQVAPFPRTAAAKEGAGLRAREVQDEDGVAIRKKTSRP